MKFSLCLIFLFSISAVFSAETCVEEPICASFTLEQMNLYCSSFLKSPCKRSCGKCLADNLVQEFHEAFDPNQDMKITRDEAREALAALNIKEEDALVTEIKDLILDTKTVLADLYKFLDANKNNEITIHEFFNGILNFCESMGIAIKPELKQTVNYIADILKFSQPGPILLPNLADLTNMILMGTQSNPHGLISLVRLTNITHDPMGYERVIIPNSLGYTIDGKMFALKMLFKLDHNDDDFVSAKEIIDMLLKELDMMNVLLVPKVHENIAVYLSMVDQSLQQILIKYGVKDPSELDGKVLPELNNQKFVDQRIDIDVAVAKPRIFTNTEVMKYVKSASNGIPSQKLTPRSISEAAFKTFDKNANGNLEMVEFTEFVVITFQKFEIGTITFAEINRLYSLFDSNKDAVLDFMEFLHAMKPILPPPAVL